MVRISREKRNRYLTRGGALALAAAVALLVAPGFAGASPACGVYCPSEVPNPERSPNEKKSGTGGSGTGGSRGGGSQDGGGSTTPADTLSQLQATSGGAALSRALGGGRESGNGDRGGSGNGDRGGNRDQGDGAEGRDGGGATPAGASLATVGSDGGGGLGLLFPLLLGLVGVWAAVIGVRRLRRRT